MAISWDGALWTASTAHALGARVVNVGNVYLVTVAGVTAAAPAAGPTGTTTGAAITDGTVTWQYLGAYTGSVLDVAPQLDQTAKRIHFGAQIVFLNLAEYLVSSVDMWGGLLDDGRRYLAAHLGELSQLRARGPITAEAVGPLSRAYASLIGPQAWQLTIAGRAYMDLVRTTPAVLGLVA